VIRVYETIRTKPEEKSQILASQLPAGKWTGSLVPRSICFDDAGLCLVAHSDILILAIQISSSISTWHVGAKIGRAAQILSLRLRKTPGMGLSLFKHYSYVSDRLRLRLD